MARSSSEVIQEVSPDRGTTTTVRDARGLATQITDGRAIVTNMTYDNAGRIKTKTYPAATAENVTYTYDNVTAPNKGKGRLTKVASQSNVIDFVYDVPIRPRPPCGAGADQIEVTAH